MNYTGNNPNHTSGEQNLEGYGTATQMPNKPTTLRDDIKSRVKNWAEDPEFWSKDIQDVIDSHNTELVSNMAGEGEPFNPSNPEHAENFPKFINKLTKPLSSYKAELLRKIEGMRKDNPTGNMDEGRFSFNQALDQVISLINQEK